MSATLNYLATYREAIRTRLLTDSMFAGVPGVPIYHDQYLGGSNQEDIEQELARKLGELGAVVYLMTPELTAIDAGPVRKAFTCDVTFHVAEIISINRSAQGTQKTAEDIVLKIWGTLETWQADDTWGPLYFARYSQQKDDEQTGLTMCELVMQCQARYAITT
jgi:hypothetical protein